MCEKRATDIQWNEAAGEVRWTLHAAKAPRVYCVKFEHATTGYWAEVRDRETGEAWRLELFPGVGSCDQSTYDAYLMRAGRTARRMTLASLVYAFDMEPYRVSGPPLRTAPKRQTKRHDTEVDPAPKPQVVQPAIAEPRRDLPAVALATVHVDGDELGVVRLPGDGPEDGWVSLPSLLAPFGKRTDHAAGLLAGWARERLAIVTSRRGGGHAAETRLVHFRDAPLVIARLDSRGMDESTREKHQRFLRVCADVLAGFFLPPPRPVAPEPVTVTAAAIGKALAEALAPLAIRLGAIEQRLSEQAPLPHAPALPAVPAGAAATLGGGLTLHAAHVDAVSQRAVARKLGLPQEGTGRSAVQVLADLESVWERAELHRMGSYVSGTGRHGDHRLITPAGVEAMQERAALYLRQVASLGWYVSAGGRLTATPAARPEYSARRVHEAALEAARAIRGEQTTMGFDA